MNDSLEGEFLKAARLKVNMSQMELGQVLGFGSGQFVSNWERGISKLPPHKIPEFVKITKCNPELLVKIKARDFLDELMEVAGLNGKRKRRAS